MNKRTTPTHVITVEMPSSMYNSFKDIMDNIY